MTRISLYKVLLNLICAFLNIIQANHRTITLEDHSLYKIKEMSNLTHFNEILDNILIPRVVGSNGHDKVNEYIVKSMRNIDWNVEIDEFQDSTPFGVLTFRNIISTNNVNADNYLILACHYDSKFFKDKDFLGATDSAVPCAMMINVVYSLRKQLGENQTNKLGLMLIFFDGEEAFERWSATDSLYGARHLANKWEEEDFLEKINLFILLDLLGSPDPQFYSYFKNTEDWYAYLLYSEKRLADIGLFDKYLYSSVVDKSPLQYFQPHSISALIEDDHIPFMQRGVKIIHLIPSPFPEVWHKMDDDRMAIDIYTVENLNKILRLFLVEYLHLNF